MIHVTVRGSHWYWDWHNFVYKTQPAPRCYLKSHSQQAADRAWATVNTLAIARLAESVKRRAKIEAEIEQRRRDNQYPGNSDELKWLRGKD